MHVKTATLNGHLRDIDICEPLDGTCDHPRSKLPTIRSMTPFHTRKELEAILHECLHAENWSVTEEVTTRSAHEIARLLWRLGYRRAVT